MQAMRIMRPAPAENFPLEDASEALLDVKTVALNGRAVLRVGESRSKLY